MRSLIAGLACLSLGATGCASLTPRPDPMPQVTIPGTTRPQVINAVSASMANSGFRIAKADEYRATFEKPGGLLENILAGSRFAPQTVWRVTLTMYDTADGVNATASSDLVTNPGTAFESLNPIGGKRNLELTTILESVKQQLATVATSTTATVAAPPPSTIPPFTPRQQSESALKAQKSSTTIERISPDESGTHAQAMIGAPRSEADRQAAVEAFLAGKDFLGRHDWARAEQSFQRAILYDGSRAEYHAALGSLMMLLHRWVDAQASYSAAVLLDVDNAEYRQQLKESRSRR